MTVHDVEITNDYHCKIFQSQCRKRTEKKCRDVCMNSEGQLETVD
jgi:hypothetical protein